MNLGISGKRALVVGASKSIGLAVAAELWTLGCNVTGIARSKPENMPYRNIQADLTHRNTLDAVCDTIGDFDIVVHAIGGSAGMTQTWGNADHWEPVWRLNLGIPHDINRIVVPGMIERGWGRIVHISSISTKAHIGYAPYQSAKAAVEGYVQAVGKELAPTGVVMTCVAPGVIWTEGRHFANMSESERNEYIKNFIPAGRLGRAEEVAQVIAFLCSESSSYMSGSIIRVDGAGR